jgi:hypothetical protein
MTRDLEVTDGSMLKDPFYASVEASYYLMRKLLFARRHPEAQAMPAVCAYLRALPPITIPLY